MGIQVEFPVRVKYWLGRDGVCRELRQDQSTHESNPLPDRLAEGPGAAFYLPSEGTGAVMDILIPGELPDYSILLPDTGPEGCVIYVERFTGQFRLSPTEVLAENAKWLMFLNGEWTTFD